ncbi:MAG TPA: hypothetical protein VMT71_01935 [Syntrophorhabdales bacterium]|nr:hypothetical protein [Syntrophorhabdales bacterium]
MKIILCAILFILMQAADLWAETKIEVFPPTGYDQATVYLNLGLFWAGIIGLLIILRLKLKELERVQKMEREEAEKTAPLLE